MAFLDMSTPYSPVFAAFYDFFISPAVVRVAIGDVRKLVDAAAPGSRILDVGCGGGQHAVEAASRRGDLRLVALDLSPVFLSRAKARARKAGVENRLEFTCASATDMPFEANAFDHVYSMGSIKHWVDLRKGLSECIRVLKPGGRLVVMEADRGCTFEDAERWAADTRVPGPLQPILQAYFRTIVTGQSIDLDDARGLWADVPLIEKEGPRRIPGTPALVMSGTKSKTEA
jgi:ubiquinone/menaquinone biosynthesis C-methylase UbiE